LISVAPPPVEDSSPRPGTFPSLGGGAGMGIAIGLIVLIMRGSARDVVMGSWVELPVGLRNSGCGI